MIKVSTFLAESENGLAAVPLFGPADSFFEKTASASLLPEVTKYISALTPRNDAQYVLVNAMGAGEYFGCFPAGTLVETEHGEQNIEEVEPGTSVRTHLNRFRPVVARTPKQAEELCDLYVQGLPGSLPSLTATPNHELWVVTRDDFLRTKRRVVWKGGAGTSLKQRREKALLEMEFSWVPIAHLQAGDYIAEPFPLEEEPRALGDEKWNCPEVAFLMGLYAAEGCVARRYDREDAEPASIICVIANDASLIDRVRVAADGLGHKLQVSPSKTGTSIRVQLCFKELAQLCLLHIGTPAPSKKLSSAILRMPTEWQREFFDAYASGDGCVRKEGKEEGAVRCVSASASLLRGMRLLLARQGLAASISGRRNKKATWYNGNPIYELTVSGGQLRGRGTSKSYLHPKGYILSSVKKVEQYSWQGEVYDLTVEGDSSYTASGMSVHNSNVNGDHFPEEALMHCPDGWTGNPLIDRTLSKNWPYGFPTFYNAHPFAHHKNKDPSRAYGEVELAVWNDHMKRVELIVRVDHDKCNRFGGVPVWDRLKTGQYPDVSMGSKVPWDACAICFDWATYQKALATFNPMKHRHPGIAVLEFHKKLKRDNGVGIRGLSVTRNDYCEHASRQMNKILPDGRKCFVYNFFARFFDISFVFIGADRTAKVMVFIVRSGMKFSVPSAVAAEKMGLKEDDSDGAEKTASVLPDVLLKSAFLKGAEEKSGEIKKDVVPSQFAGKAIPLLTRCEDDLPDSVMQLLGSVPLRRALATMTGMGMLLKPGEFSDLASRKGGELDVQMGSDDFLPALARLLQPLMNKRSALGPFIERRITIISTSPKKEREKKASHSFEQLRKIGAAYNSYRRGVMELVAGTQELLKSAAGSRDTELHKLAEAAPEELFTPLAYRYLDSAFMDEVPFAISQAGMVEKTSVASVERGLPSRNTWT